MKVFTWILMGLILLGCKREKELTPEEIAPLVGKWRQVAYEKVTDNRREWVNVTDTAVYNTVIFRADGVPLYGNGKGMCCAPRMLIIGGRPFKIEPKSPVELDGLCAMIDCLDCESVELEIKQDVMIWTLCTGHRTRYQRVP
jgi:hypothetical protein